jgi:5-formyltetrahydrofolate cyclo-ligase
MRRQIRQIRQSLSLDVQHQASQHIVSSIIQLAVYQQAISIAAYVADEGEIDAMQVLVRAQDEKSCYLPVLASGKERRLHFYEYSRQRELVSNRYGILEPDVTQSIEMSAEGLDIVLVPLVLFDSKCHRVGRGAGYYDRTFEFKNKNQSVKPLLIGLAYEFQKTEALQPEPWDIPLDWVVTEKAVYQREDSN